MLLQEFLLLKESEKQDQALKARLDAKMAERTDILAKIAECQEKLEMKKDEVPPCASSLANANAGWLGACLRLETFDAKLIPSTMKRLCRLIVDQIVDTMLNGTLFKDS